MALFKSDQITKVDAVPRDLLPSQDAYGRVRRSYFNFVVPAGNIAVNDTVELARGSSPASRLYGGRIAFEAMSTAGGTAQVQIGDGTTAAKYLGTTSVDAAGEADFGNSVALNIGEKVTSKFRLTATALGEAWAAGQRLTGYIGLRPRLTGRGPAASAAGPSGNGIQG